MKYLILLLALSFGCSDHETQFIVAADDEPYVTSFFTEAEARGKTLPKSNLLVSLNSDCQAITQIKRDDDQWILEMDGEVFNTMVAQGNPNNLIESYLFHELGRIVLQREFSSEFSIMNPQIKVNGFSSSDREALLDELFK
jgi:hypothetical protein